MTNSPESGYKRESQNEELTQHEWDNPTLSQQLGFPKSSASAAYLTQARPGPGLADRPTGHNV